ncbi:DUF5605 domain-containing protein [Ruminiclostridium cellobioparum]|uniref:DUF5605 domain-containing protein n=1 Tax=Ruminiclostridium cellobioparum TaxID=29355 RepID=UPI000485EF03|nr:DUF5605 domain-containing protein [Ruminiclostridium cellobioparum]
MEIGFQNVVRNFYFDNESEYRVEVIDTWEMAIKEAGVFKGKFTVELSGKEYMAIRIRNPLANKTICVYRYSNLNTMFSPLYTFKYFF